MPNWSARRNWMCPPSSPAEATRRWKDGRSAYLPSDGLPALMWTPPTHPPMFVSRSWKRKFWTMIKCLPDLPACLPACLPEIECARPLTRWSDQKWKDGRSAYLPACHNVPAHSPTEATRNGKMVHYEVMHMQPCLLFRHHHHKWWKKSFHICVTELCSFFLCKTSHIHHILTSTGKIENIK